MIRLYSFMLLTVGLLFSCSNIEEPESYSLTITTQNGTVLKSPDRDSYSYNDSVTLTAVPSTGYHFENWSDSSLGTQNPVKFAITGNEELSAFFSIDSCNLSVITPIVNGTIEKNPLGAKYAYGEITTLTAVPSPGYHFACWEGNIADNNASISVTITGNINTNVLFSYNSIDSLVDIRSGSFFEGDQTDPSAQIHQVSVNAFKMSNTEVSQQEYKRVVGKNPSSTTDNLLLPVDNVSWYDAVLYCNKRSKMEGKDTVYTYTGDTIDGYGSCIALVNISYDFSKKGYRLPDETEWEYAAKAGTSTKYPFGNDSLLLNEYAWYAYNNPSYFIGHPTPNYLRPVASRRANQWGLFDMIGNVYEWCNNNTFERKRVRGGYINSYPWECESSNRNSLLPSGHYAWQGFRIVLPL